MNEISKTKLLGNYIFLLILNNKMRTNGIISESMQVKISSEIQADYQKNLNA